MHVDRRLPMASTGVRQVGRLARIETRRAAQWVLALVVALAWGGAAALAAAADLALPGPYLVGVQELDVPRPGGGTFPAKFFYPALSAGSNTTFNPAGGQYAAISFGHGFLQNVNSYDSTLSHLASYGYLVIAPRTEQGLLPSHANFATDLQQALDYLQNQNSTPASPYFNHVNVDAFGLSGHSMGGGASILAGAADTRIKAIANMAAANTNPSAIAAMPSVTAPINLLSGTADIIAPAGQHQQPMYNAGLAPKQFTSIQGGSHCYFEDVLACGGSITRDEQLEVTRRELTTFFNFYLQHDESLWRQVWGPEAATADPLVSLTSASGIGVSPDATSQLGLPGQPISYQVTVTNNGRSAAHFDLFAEDNTWNTVISPAVTPPLSPGQSFTATVQISPPAGAFNSQNQVLISARTSADGLTRGYTQLTAQTGAFNGELAVASLANSSALKFSPAGAGSVFADAGDGLLAPLASSYDAAGNLYVADVLRSRVTRFTPAGTGSVFADAADGLSTPAGLTLAPDGTLFVTNYLSNTVTRVDASGAGSLFADAADGLSSPFGLASDAAGNLYVASLGASQVLKITPAGVASVFADAGDGLLAPFGIAIDAGGNIYVSDVLRSRVTRFTPAGAGSLFADAADGLTTPAGLAFDGLGNLFVSNYLSNTIVRVDPAGVGSLFADAGDGVASPFGLAARTLLPGGAGGAAAAVPEPASGLLALGGLLALAASRWRSHATARRAR